MTDTELQFNRLRAGTALTIWNTFASVAVGLILANLIVIDNNSLKMYEMTQPSAFYTASILGIAAWVRANIAIAKGNFMVHTWMLFLIIVSLFALIFGLLLIMVGESFGYFLLGFHLLLWGITGLSGHPRTNEPSSDIIIFHEVRIFYMIVTTLGAGMVIGAVIAVALNNAFWEIGPHLINFAICSELLILWRLENV